MGLGKFLTTPFGCKMRFREPPFFRARLRGEMKRKWITTAICMGLGISGMLIAAASSDHPKASVPNALILGAMIGGFLSIVFSIRSKDGGGTVYLRSKHIRRTTLESHVLDQWYTRREETWPYPLIEKCHLIHRSSSGLGFSVLEVHMPDAIDEIGVPRSVNIRLLVRSLKESGVSVSYEGDVPFSELPTPLIDTPLKALLSVLLKALIIIIAALIFYYKGMDFLANRGRDEPKKPAGNAPVAENPVPAAAPNQRPVDRSPKRKPARQPAQAKQEEDRSSGLGNRAANARSKRPSPSEAPAVRPSYRTWADATGRFQVEAILVGRQGDDVALRKRDGLTVVVPASRLCAADQAYLAASAFVTEEPGR